MHRGSKILPKLFEDLGIGKNARILYVGTGMGYVLKGLKSAEYENVLVLEPGGRFDKSPFYFVLQLLTYEFI